MKFKNYLQESTCFTLKLDETIVLKQETADMINNISAGGKLKRIVKKIFGYGKKSDYQGWAMARIMTTNLMNDFLLKMGKAYEEGKKFNLKAELNKKMYDKVTEPFDDWWREYVTIVYNELYKKGK